MKQDNETNGAGAVRSSDWLGDDQFWSLVEWRARQIIETGKVPREVTLTPEQYDELRASAKQHAIVSCNPSGPEVMGMRIRIKSPNEVAHPRREVEGGAK